MKIYIDALYYNEMFYSTECCNTAATVEREMKNLNSKSSKTLAFKENISTRVMYWGWEDLIMHWFNNGKDFTPEDLTSYIKMIVPKQQSCSIPTKPPVLIPAQKALT